LIEILDQLVDALDAHRHPDEIVGDAQSLSILDGHAEMGASRGSYDERFRSTQAGGMNGNPESRQEALGDFCIPGVERDHAAEAGEESVRDLMAGILG